MESFKIDLFEQEHSTPFPLYRSLSPAEGQGLQTRLAKQFDLLTPTTGLAVEFAHDLASRQTYYHEANAKEGFALLPMLAQLGIIPLPELFVNWGRFDKLDAFQTADVARYFNDLWYPSADDIDLFDASARWVVSIRHDGTISFIH